MRIRVMVSDIDLYGRKNMGLILLIILILLLAVALPTWGYSRSWGYYPGGIVGTILIIVLVLLLLGYL